MFSGLYGGLSSYQRFFSVQNNVISDSLDKNPKLDFIEKSSEVEQCAEPRSIREKKYILIIMQVLQVHWDQVKAMIKVRFTADDGDDRLKLSVRANPMKPFHKRFITLVRLELTRNLRSIIYFNLRGQTQDPKIKTIQSQKTAQMNLDLVNMPKLLDHKVCFLYSKVRISLTWGLIGT